MRPPAEVGEHLTAVGQPPHQMVHNLLHRVAVKDEPIQPLVRDCALVGVLAEVLGRRLELVQLLLQAVAPGAGAMVVSAGVPGHVVDGCAALHTEKGTTVFALQGARGLAFTVVAEHLAMLLKLGLLHLIMCCNFNNLEAKCAVNIELVFL